ncbi:hypothetical protein D9M70_499750 [compost metagenome]
MVVPGQDVDPLAGEFLNPLIHDKRILVLNGARHRLAPAGDDRQVGGRGVLQAQLLQMGTADDDVADELGILGRHLAMPHAAAYVVLRDENIAIGHARCAGEVGGDDVA